MSNTATGKLLALFNSRLAAIEDEKLRLCLSALGDDIVSAIGAQKQDTELSRPVKVSTKEQGGSIQIKGLSRFEDVRASGNVSWGQRPFILTTDMDGDGNASGVLAQWNQEIGEYEPIPSVSPMMISDPFSKASGLVADDVLLATWDTSRGATGRSLGQDREGGYIVTAPYGNPSDLVIPGAPGDVITNFNGAIFGAVTGVPSQTALLLGSDGVTVWEISVDQGVVTIFEIIP